MLSYEWPPTMFSCLRLSDVTKSSSCRPSMIAAYVQNLHCLHAKPFMRCTQCCIAVQYLSLQCSAVPIAARCRAVQYPLLQCSSSILRTCKQSQAGVFSQLRKPIIDPQSCTTHIYPQTMQQHVLARRVYNHDVSRTDSCS